MATTYKFLSSTETETLTANIFADGVQIHDGHRLDPCTEYVWYHDPLDSEGNPTTGTIVQEATRIGAGGNTFDVELDDVGNSGEYWCEIRVGQTRDCWITTARRRITIVDCRQGTTTFSAAGGSETIFVVAPHYERPVFSPAGLSWITTVGGIVPCDTTTMNVCLFAQSLTAEAQDTSTNSARRGQVTIAVGELTCFYGLVQDYYPATPAAPEADTPPGPFINLSQNGPSIVGTPITVTADVGTLGGDGTETYTVTWPDGSTGLTYEVTATIPDIQTITATVEDNNMLTATASIVVEHRALVVTPTRVIGDTIGFIGSQRIFAQEPTLTRSGNFGIEGGNTFFARLSLTPTGYFGGRTGNYQATLTLTGPGVNATEVISANTANFVSREIEFTGSGNYNWTFEWTDSETRPETGEQSEINQSTAQVFFAGQLF